MPNIAYHEQPVNFIPYVADQPFDLELPRDLPLDSIKLRLSLQTNLDAVDGTANKGTPENLIKDLRVETQLDGTINTIIRFQGGLNSGGTDMKNIGDALAGVEQSGNAIDATDTNDQNLDQHMIIPFGARVLSLDSRFEGLMRLEARRFSDLRIKGTWGNATTPATISGLLAAAGSVTAYAIAGYGGEARGAGMQVNISVIRGIEADQTSILHRIVSQKTYQDITSGNNVGEDLDAAAAFRGFVFHTFDDRAAQAYADLDALLTRIAIEVGTEKGIVERYNREWLKALAENRQEYGLPNPKNGYNFVDFVKAANGDIRAIADTRDIAAKGRTFKWLSDRANISNTRTDIYYMTVEHLGTRINS
ncbi:MAG: hypothetical protein ACYS1A_16880 [Planctomycetota bacterium]|jgi:hypothetical protein